MVTVTEAERALIEGAVVRLRARIMAVVFGFTGGTAIFVATAWLLIRGGPNVGMHLQLLSNFFPGYTVSWPGAFLGFFYGALSGGLLGWALAVLYNRVASTRLTA